MKVLSLPSLAVAVWILAAATAAAQTQSMTLNADRDNTLYNDGAGNLSNGAGQHFFAGTNASNEARRGLLHFDVAGNLPVGSIILSATLQLNMSRTISGNQTVSLHRVTTDWGEGSSNASGQEGGGAPSATGDATWVHAFFSGTPWATPGGDFVAGASAQQMVGFTLGPYTWTSPQMAADVQSWLDTPANNFGWLVQGNEAVPAVAKRFDTRENNTPSVRPQLMLTFVAGSPASLTATGTGCTGSSGAPLMLAANGNPSLGNAAFTLDLTGGPFGGAASIFVGDMLAPSPTVVVPGCSIFLDLPNVLGLVAQGIGPLGPVALDGTGAGSLPLPLSNNPSLALFSISLQAVAVDATVVTGAVASNALTLAFGT